MLAIVNEPDRFIAVRWISTVRKPQNSTQGLQKQGEHVRDVGDAPK